MNNLMKTAQIFFGRVWNSLTQPHPSLTDIAEQRFARLASSFLLTILALSIIGVIVRIPRLGLVEAFLGPFASAIGVLFIAYLISRSQWYRGAVFLFSLSFSALGYLNMIQQGNQVDFGTQALIYVPLSLIVASSFLSAPAVFLLVGLNVGAYFSIQAFGITLPENIGAQTGMITIIGLVLMLLANFRNNIERIRLAEIQSTNRELETLTVSLEQRVAARTRDLAIVAEVGTATSTILETDRLLQEVVNLTKERFSLYHSHIYLLDEAGENLVLASGAGEVGRTMVAEKRSIPLSREQSLVARAARERQGVTVNDVTLAPDFLPNPLLPETRSELAVPMLVGGNVIGVFDIQSEQAGRFTEADISVQTTLAAQVATSVQNVRQFERSKAQADLESMVNAIGQKIQRAASVEEVLQTAARELGTALGASRVSANIQSARVGNITGEN